MTDLHGIRLGVAVCGSFCNAARAVETAKLCAACGAEILPVVSEHFASVPTRFGAPEDFLEPDKLPSVNARHLTKKLEKMYNEWLLNCSNRKNR